MTEEQQGGNSLFLVQNADRPCYVVASCYNGAVAKWRKQMSDENDCEPDEVDSPDGVQLLGQIGGDFPDVLL